MVFGIGHQLGLNSLKEMLHLVLWKGNRVVYSMYYCDNFKEVGIPPKSPKSL